MSGPVVSFQIEGMQELLEDLHDLSDKAPKAALSKGVRKGANKIMRDAKADVPVYSGTLRNSLKLKTEKGNRGMLKTVVDVMFDPAFNSVLQKHVNNAGKYGGTPGPGNTYYYPASMEYGFRTGQGWSPGHYFLKHARDMNDQTFPDTIEEALNAELAKLRVMR
jgi:hypothetical protein